MTMRWFSSTLAGRLLPRLVPSILSHPSRFAIHLPDGREGKEGECETLLLHPSRKSQSPLDAFDFVCHRRTEVQGSHEADLHQPQLICSLWTVGLRAAHAGLV
jgi:hypothetical protein